MRGVLPSFVEAPIVDRLEDAKKLDRPALRPCSECRVDVDGLDDARSVMLDPGRVFFSGYAKFSCFPFLFHWKRLPFFA